MEKKTSLNRWLVRSAVMLLVLFGLVSEGRAAEPFFFVQLSDPQFGMFTENREFSQETVNFEFAVATVNRLRPAFVIITGDLVHLPDDEAQNVEYLRILGKVDPGIRVYNVAGNHDVENVPTPGSVANYKTRFGPDYYTFRHGGLVGIVLNSMLIHSPQETTREALEQKDWLRGELTKARDERAQHIVVFQHHPWFLKAPDEPDEYFNIPRERREVYLGLFRENGVKYSFAGHYHRNAVARDGEFEAVTTGPVGKPLGRDGSGLRVVIVRDEGIEHRYYHFGEVPNQIELSPARRRGRGAGS